MPVGDDLVGRNITLSCAVIRGETKNMPKIFWSGPGPIGSQNMTGLSSTLSLDPLRAANAGTYMCHASFESATGNESISVTATCKKYQICMLQDYYFIIIDSFQWTWS